MQNTLDLLIDKTQPSTGWHVSFMRAATGIISIIVIANMLLK